ncbi:E3 ubiquitin-protein ligase SIAH1A-like [Cloeon dipterum]|uniref:E3 ubiquitin-protein ligase SIAH1A-like n=1 Tax=Cloeon dipterum TaxID=197152 RepID=UPI00321FF272
MSSKKKSVHLEGPSKAKRKAKAVDLSELYKCPVCFEYVLTPIQQCTNGHIVCFTCKLSLEICPICRVKLLDNVRNLLMEKNKSNGCGLKLKVPERTEHEALCPFQMYRCPFPGANCWWSGILDKVLPHLQEEHEVESVEAKKHAGNYNCAIKVPTEGCTLTHFVKTVTVEDHAFFVSISKRDEMVGRPRIYATVQFFGLAGDAKKFWCRLTTKSKQRVLTFKSAPRSIQEDLKDLIAKQECLIIELDIANSIAEEGNLVFNLSITDKSQK